MAASEYVQAMFDAGQSPQISVPSWVTRETHLSFKFRRRTKTVTSAVAEVYHRDDVPCGSELCTSGCHMTLSRLAADAAFYIMPDAETLTAYLEVFELPEVTNTILLGSVIKQMQVHSTSRKVQRARALYRDQRRRCILFSNDVCRFTAETGSADVDPVMTAAHYFFHHLDGAVPIVVVSDRLSNDGVKLPRGTRRDIGRGVVLLSAAEFFSASIWPHSAAVTELFDSLQHAAVAAAAAAAAADGEHGALCSGYRGHWTQQQIEDGLAAGELLQGVIHVSKRDPHEAAVQVGSGAESGPGRLLRLDGRAAMNRALEGDTVAIRLVERAQAAVATASPAPGAATAAPGTPGRPANPPGSAGDALVAAVEQVDLDAADPGQEGVDYGAQLLDADVVDDECGDDGGGGVLGARPAEALMCAEVVGILQRHMTDVVASVSQQDEEAVAAADGTGNRQEAVLCVPVDRRFPYVRVRTRHAAKLVGQRFVLRIDSWDRRSRYPNGHVVRLLGAVNDLKAESEAVLVTCGVAWQPFCDAAMAELPRVTSASEWIIPSAECASRRDLTGDEYFICSIDPPGCTDVDDALHVRRLPDGGIEVGVHIADVSYFVQSGGMLDGEARSRCTTVYLVDRRLDMLPALLSEQLCSLRSGAMRLAVSVIWQLDDVTRGPLGGAVRVRNTWFGRTLIQSRHQLSYQQAQDVLDGVPPAPGDALPPGHVPVLRDGLQQLKAITDRLHAARLEAGALELASAELRFVVGPDGQPLAVQPKNKVAMMDVVAEMMIWANAAVAERIATAYPGCALLRNHPPPRTEAFEQVRGLLEAAPGSDGTAAGIDPSSNRSLSSALAEACGRQRDPAAALLIKALITRAMSEAKYFSTGAAAPGSAGAYHYGLALPYYTHFTSPIRRYADVVVHRQLLGALAQPQAAPPPLQHAELAVAAAAMNARHRESKRAQKECSEMYLLLLLHAHPHCEPAIICGLGESHVMVFVPKYQLRGRAHMVDRRGRVILPLEGDEDEADASPSGSLRYQSSESAAEITCSTSGRDDAASDVVWRGELSQRVWVRLSADGSRAHGPKLHIRLLSDTHPHVLAAELAMPSDSSQDDVNAAGRSQRGGVNNAGVAPSSSRASSTQRNGHATARSLLEAGATDQRQALKVTAVLPPEAAAATVVSRSSRPAPLEVVGAMGTAGRSAALCASMEPGVSAVFGEAQQQQQLADSDSAAAMRMLQAKVARYGARLAACSSTSHSRIKWLAKVQEARAQLLHVTTAAIAC